MAAGLRASTHAVCRLRSAFLRIDAQARECARAAVVKPHVNECLLPPSVLRPLLFHFHVFNESVKSRAAVGELDARTGSVFAGVAGEGERGGWWVEEGLGERRGGGGGSAQRMWGLRACCNECSAS